MPSHRLVAGALATALTFALAATPAHALVVARVTRHGYILVDEPDASNVYQGLTPVANTQATLQYVGDVTAALDAVGAPHADYIATMQTDYEQSALAFYLGIRNDTLGIGERDPQRGTVETYDLNNFANTTWPVTGFVFLNTIQLYMGGTMGGGRNLGPDVICTQEFGHRFGAFVRIPPYPAATSTTDGGAGDAASSDVTTTVDVTTDDVTTTVDVTTDDAATTDDAGGAPDAASAPDVAPPPPLAADALLGRQRAHWSYFVNSGGSPMEGNNWAETSPGVFTTQAYTPRFSPLDLYLMGLIPAEQVPPFWLIAEANVNGQMDSVGEVINRESPPNSRSNRRPVTIRGRRVTYTIDDIIRANGRRNPAYAPYDGGAGDGGTVSPHDMAVAWVLLTTPERVTAALATAFDNAIEVCSTGYGNAAQNLSHLVPIVGAPPPDVVATDAAADAAPVADAAPTNDALDPAELTPPARGCSCRTTSAGSSRSALGALTVLGLAATLSAARRSRRRRHSRHA